METMGIAYLATRARWPRYFICLVFNSEWGKGLWGPLLYRDHYRDPIPHSLLSTRESWCREGPSRPFVLFGVGVRWFRGRREILSMTHIGRKFRDVQGVGLRLPK